MSLGEANAETLLDLYDKELKAGSLPDSIHLDTEFKKAVLLLLLEILQETQPKP